MVVAQASRPFPASKNGEKDLAARDRKLTVCVTNFGGAEGDRTPDLRIANAALCQTELLPHDANENTVSSLEFQVGEIRNELATKRHKKRKTEFRFR